MNCRGAALLLVLLVLPGGLLAQQRPPQLGCTQSSHREFDFWIGDWTVTNPAGQTIGKNVIRSIQGGCALEENWTGGGGGTGISLNYVEAGKWHQLWVPNIAGAILHLTGGVQNGAMIMTGESTNPQGAKVLNRVTWTPIEQGKVTQNWDVSTDGGKTWTPSFRGIYSRAPAGRE